MHLIGGHFAHYIYRQSEGETLSASPSSSFLDLMADCAAAEHRWGLRPHGILMQNPQLQPLVLPQLGQAWQLPARIIWTPHCMHIGESL